MATTGCTGPCSACLGCEVRDLTLTEEEIHILRLLGQIPFLPVARKPDSMAPVFLEDERYDRETCSLVLQCLEKKHLIDLDYTPLKGMNYEAYAGFPVQGSMALTERGQTVLELLDLQGIVTD